MCLLGALGFSGALAAVPLPFYTSCSSLDGFTTEGNVGRRWTVKNDDGIDMFCIQPRNSTTYQNAYLWLPAIKLEKEGTYRFAVDVKTLRDTPGRFELLISDQPSSTSGNISVIRPSEICYKVVTPFDCYYRATADQEVYLGIHVTSPPEADNFYVDNILVEEVSGRVPKAVTDIKATPGASGKKNVEISFKTPTQRVSGAALRNGLTKIDVFCDHNLVHTIEAPKANTDYSFTHTPSLAGTHLYVVRPASEEGYGGTAYVLPTLGAVDDVPTTLTDRKGYRYAVPAVYNDTTGKVTLTWEPRKGNEKARYDVYRMPENVKVATALSDTTFAENAIAGTDPIAYYYKVNAVYNDSTATVGISSVISLHSQVPFVSPFTSQQAFNEYTLADPRAEGGWWSYSSGLSAAAANDGGDWLITPGIRLEAGKRYRVQVEAKCNWRPVYYSMSLGRTNDYRGLGTEILPNDVVTSRTSEMRETYISVDASGEYFFGICAFNPNDPEIYSTIHIRNIRIEEVAGGVPHAVENLRPVYDPSDVRKAKIAMTAPSKSVDENTLTSLSKIELLKDGVVVATLNNPAPASEVSFDIDVVPEELVTYAIVPYTEAGQGVLAQTDVMLIDPAYRNEFPDASSLNGYTLIDVEKDGFGWEWFNNQARAYPHSVAGPTVDWMMTPAVHLEKGKYYVANFVVTREKNEYSPSNVSLSIGKEPKIESMTSKVIDDYQPWGVGYDERVLVKNYFTVDETGAYYLGFCHSVADGRNGSAILIDNFTISDKIAGEVPDTVTSYIISPNMDGELRGEIKFNAPTKALNGTALAQGKAMQIDVLIDGNNVGTQQATPGQSLTVPVSVAETGVHLISVIPSNEHGRGREAEDVAFFGINRPGYPLEVKVVEDPENYGTVTISWIPDPLDYDGFPMNQKHVTYEIIDLTGENENIIARNLTDTVCTLQVREPNQPQSFMRFAVRARTSFGGSPGVYAPYVAVGKPYSLPLKESFANYSPKMTMVQQSIDDTSGLCMWGFNSGDPFGNGCYDGDSGMALMEAIFAGVHKRLVTGKIDLRTAKNPKLEMRVLRYPNRQRPTTNIIGIEVGTTTAEWDSVAYRTIEEWAEGEEGWQRMEVDLSKYVGKIIYVGIVGHSESHTFTCFDAFEVAEAKQKNLGYVAFQVPEVANIGETVDMICRVKNHGHSDAQDYTVNLYRNDEKVLSLPGKLLRPGEKAEFVLKERIDIDGKESNKYYVIIDNPGDEDSYDNRTKNVMVELASTDFPKPVGLTGEQTDGGSVTLNWSAPALPDKPQSFTDDFESYPSWSTQHTGMGKYKFLDNDDLGIAGIQGVELPGIPIMSKQSWFLFDRTLSPFDTLTIANTHSGNKMMACMTLYEQYYADDWLILPELSGQKQTISFWARSYVSRRPEVFCVHWSTTGTDFTDFAQQETSTPLIGPVSDQWTKYEFEVPEGTRFFAIRRYCGPGFMLFVDDLTYIPAGHERLKIQGYNVYCNGKRVNDEVVTATSYSHKPGTDGIHTYSVATQYNLGQSPLADVNIDFVGLNSIDYTLLEVKGMNGYISIAGAEGLGVEVYAADGLAIYRSTADSDMLRISAPAGVYAVRIGTRTFKVIVR